MTAFSGPFRNGWAIVIVTQGAAAPNATNGSGITMWPLKLIAETIR